MHVLGGQSLKDLLWLVVMIVFSILTLPALITARDVHAAKSSLSWGKEQHTDSVKLTRLIVTYCRVYWFQITNWLDYTSRELRFNSEQEQEIFLFSTASTLSVDLPMLLFSGYLEAGLHLCLSLGTSGTIFPHPKMPS